MIKYIWWLCRQIHRSIYIYVTACICTIQTILFQVSAWLLIQVCSVRQLGLPNHISNTVKCQHPLYTFSRDTIEKSTHAVTQSYSVLFVKCITCHIFTFKCLKTTTSCPFTLLCSYIIPNVSRNAQIQRNLWFYSTVHSIWSPLANFHAVFTLVREWKRSCQMWLNVTWI